MKVQNMESANGNKIANQFILTDDDGNVSFQSYDTVIAKTLYDSITGKDVFLDRDKWNCSKTTSKYRSIFLGETTKETQKKIDSGEYVLTDLNS